MWLGNNNIKKLQVVYVNGKQQFVLVKEVAYVFGVHMQSLRKQAITWKLYAPNSPSREFYKGNDIQSYGPWSKSTNEMHYHHVWS